jgi:hypothetical protein
MPFSALKLRKLQPMTAARVVLMGEYYSQLGQLIKKTYN